MDIPARLREFARLDRQRREGGLSPSELERWETLKSFLANQFDAAPEPRAATAAPTRLNVRFASDAELCRCLMTNVARGGLFVRIDRPLALKSCFTLRIQVDRPSRDYAIPVEVVSVGVGPAFASGRPGMGLRFLEIAPAIEKPLRELIDRARRELAARGSPW